MTGENDRMDGRWATSFGFHTDSCKLVGLRPMIL